MTTNEHAAKIWKSLIEWGFITLTVEDLTAIGVQVAADEREACARIAENLYGNEPPMDYNRDLQKAGRNIAEAIRNRGEQST